MAAPTAPCREDVCVVADGEQFGIGGAGRRHEGLQLGQHFAGWGDHDHREAAVDQRDGAMQKVGAAVRLDHRVRHFLELEGELEGGGVVEAAADGDAGSHVAIAFGDGGDMVLEGERLGHEVGRAHEGVHLRGIAVEAGAQQRDGPEFGGVGFGGGHRFLFARVEVNDVIGHMGEVGVGRVGDGRSQRALALRFGQHAHDVGAFAALGDAENERLAEAWRRCVDAEEAGRGERDRQAVGCAEEILRVAGGVVAGAAGGDEDVINLARDAWRRSGRPLWSSPRPADGA